MRWDNLFEDLEHQLASELNAEEADVLIEEERLRQSRLIVRDRIRALLHSDSGGSEVRLVLVDDTQLALVPTTFGQDWLAGEIVQPSRAGRECILPLDSIRGILLGPDQIPASLEPLPDEPPSGLSARLTLPFVLRDLARRRAPVELRLSNGSLRGTIDRVGRDHLDLAIHEPGSPRRDALLTEYRIVRLDELVLVRL